MITGSTVRKLLTFSLASAISGISSPAISGEHADARLILHIAPGVEYTSSYSDYAGLSDLRDPADAVVSVPIPVIDPDLGYLTSDKADVWYVLACFQESPGPVNLCGIGFGFGDFDDGNIEFLKYSSCFEEGLEIKSSGWPGSNEGTTLAATSYCKYAEISEIYWFASYVYGEVLIPLAPNQHSLSSEYVNLGNSSHEEVSVVTDYIYDEAHLGKLGFGVPGYNPFSTAPATGACCSGSYCEIITFEDCTSSFGDYKGDHTDCFPDPCNEVFKVHWGELKKKFDYY